MGYLYLGQLFLEIKETFQVISIRRILLTLIFGFATAFLAWYGIGPLLNKSEVALKNHFTEPTAICQDYLDCMLPKQSFDICLKKNKKFKIV